MSAPPISRIMPSPPDPVGALTWFVWGRSPMGVCELCGSVSIVLRPTGWRDLSPAQHDEYARALRAGEPIDRAVVCPRCDPTWDLPVP